MQVIHNTLEQPAVTRRRYARPVTLDPRFYTGPQCQQLLGVSRWEFSKVRADEAAQFPLPTPCTRNNQTRVRFSKKAVDNWIETRDVAAVVANSRYRRALKKITRITDETDNDYVQSLMNDECQGE